MSTKFIHVTTLAMLAFLSLACNAQTITREAAYAQGKAMGTAVSIGSNLLGAGIGALGSALKSAVSGTSAAQAPDSVGAGATSGTIAVVITPSPGQAKPSTTASASAEGADAADLAFARVPRASFEAAIDRTVVVIPEHQRAEIKTRALADYDARIARFNQSTGATDEALALALASVNTALKQQ